MTTPYGLAIDGSGNVWVANASCVTAGATQCTPGALVLSELIGAAAPTITPLSAQNAGISQGTEPQAVIAQGRTAGAAVGGANKLKGRAAATQHGGYALHLPASISIQ